MLDLNRLRLLMSSLRKEGYTILNIEFCGQGEPLDHKDFPALLGIIKEHYPKTRLRIITNGNHVYSEKLRDLSVDEIMVSIDGAIQANYEKYRINGDLEKALAFTKDAKAAGRASKIVWKYILFDHNDSLEEIALAEQLAQDIEVDELQFVRTHTIGKSVVWENKTLPLSWAYSVDTATPRLVKDMLSVHDR